MTFKDLAMTSITTEGTRNLYELNFKMADSGSKSDDECTSKISVSVKTPTNNESIEVAEDASIKEVS